ncbi:cell division protein FtsW [Anaerolineae bacterium CFX9]|nr:cell division protein FtsW [Anaerolineae bacterium CFX9]
MTDQPLPQFTDEGATVIRSRPRTAEPSARPVDVTRAATQRRGLLGTIDLPIVVVVALLLSIGGMMVYSTTFDWALQDFGSETFIFMQHVRNMGIGLILLVLLMLIDYRIWKRFAALGLLLTIGSLIAVLVFSDQVFGARRSFLNGSYQPGELAELTVIVYLAAWMSSKKTKVGSLFGGLIPFAVVIGIVCALVMLQPDLSTAATIFLVSGMLFFLAGANLYYLSVIGLVMGAGGFILSQQLSYAQDRVSSFTAGLTDLTQTAYHAQQAIIAFLNGGWTGVGLGQGRQKFGFLPAPHTDSIFAVIGEELGVIGATFVVIMFIIFVWRGLSIARRARDPFGSLLAAGITLWVISKALMNIAVMLSLVPPTGVALPFISFGGSSLVVVMAGAGLLLSISRVTTLTQTPEGRGARADLDRGWGNRWSRLSGAGRR